MRGLVDEMDHQVSVIATTDPRALDSVDPAQIMRRGEAMRPLLDWRGEKENAGRFTWTLGLYGTAGDGGRGGHRGGASTGSRSSTRASWTARTRWPAGARSASAWRSTRERLDALRDRAGARDGRGRRPEGRASARSAAGSGGSGRNIPSFEIFTSPDWRGTEGWIHCNQPLYRYGNLVRGIRLAFADGRVTEASAERERAGPDGDDRHRGSRPHRRVLAHRPALLADHPLHGPDALRRERRGASSATPTSRSGAPTRTPTTATRRTLEPEDWERLGFNNSSVHTDVVSTTERTVTPRSRAAPSGSSTGAQWGVPTRLDREVTADATRALREITKLCLPVADTDGRMPSSTPPQPAGRSLAALAREDLSEPEVRTLLDQLPAILYIAEVGVEGRWLYVFRWTKAILGFSPAEWIDEFGPVGTPDAPRRSREHVRARGKPRRALHARRISPAPPRRADRLGARRSRACDDAGGRLRWHGVISDITDRKLARPSSSAAPM